MIKHFLGTKPTEHATEVLERAVDKILKDVAEIDGMQLGLLNCKKNIICHMDCERDYRENERDTMRYVVLSGM